MSEYPHMCRDGHEEIGFSNSEIELCPVCDVMGQLGAARAEIEEYSLEQGALERVLDAERDRRDNAERELAEEKEIVDRVWAALGITTYEGAGGKLIDEIVAEHRRELERMTKALDDVAHWRENCHECDEDMDHEPRAFDDDEEWDIIERFALDAKEQP